MTQENIQLICDDPKSFLLKKQTVKELIIAKRARIKEWRALATDISFTLESGGGISSGGYKKSLVETSVCNIIDLESEIFDEITKLIAIEHDIIEAIQLLSDDRYRAVLELHYLNGYNLNYISRKLHYSIDWVYRLHKAALLDLQQCFKVRAC